MIDDYGPVGQNLDVTDYPRALYRKGDLSKHKLGDVELKVQGKYSVETMTVANADEELAAMEDGWFGTPKEAEDAATEAELEKAVQKTEAALAKTVTAKSAGVASITA